MKTKISALQLYLMLFLSRVIVSITINVQTVGGSNLIESIFSSLGLFLYLTVFSLPLFVLHKSHPEASLLQIAENNCGRGVSVPMSAIYALYFIVMNIFSLSLFLTLLVNTTDPVASRFSIVLVVLGIALYGAIRGIETISRASVCIFTLFMLGMGMIFLAVSPNVTPHYLMPLFYDGTDQTVQGFLVFTARCSSLAEFAVLMPFLTSTDTKSGKATACSALSFGTAASPCFWVCFCFSSSRVSASTPRCKFSPHTRSLPSRRLPAFSGWTRFSSASA